MDRLIIKPRENWKSQLDSIGFHYHTLYDQPYWNESACYYFQENEIDDIKKASVEIQKLCLEVVDYVVRNSCYERLHITEHAWPLIESSWKKEEKSFYGRFDFSYDGVHPPKLLEYNADSPVCLLEAGLVQDQWIHDVRPYSNQFNVVHDRLVAMWKDLGFKKIHLACLKMYDEGWYLLPYLAKTIEQAGFESKIIEINKIMWNNTYFLDHDHEVINALYKMYPWEWMLNEAYDRFVQTGISVIEPAWKMILSNKGLLVMLWELFPDHPNLLPAYYEVERFDTHYVKKPNFGREGQNITLNYQGGVIATEGQYEKEKFIYQQVHLLPNFGGHYPVIGSWMIGGEPSGIIVTEDQSPITSGLSPAVPHFFD